ncbi:MAG: tRNA 2-thiocytidine biosynthesis TtcA family protein [Erysipelotrichaceae bacterium]|nr:tRNA 2-thiocytidine biosynthesis TtcA family protein [Erysipelotrichaceae bacterium]
MSIKKILSTVRKADEMFELIENGDKIGVGISGGKDSSLLLYALRLYQYLAKNSLNKEFEIIGIHINMNFGEDNIESLDSFLKENDCPFYKEDSKIADILNLNKKNDEIQCSLCSTLKKGAVIEAAKKLGCNKVAFAHHADDAIETLLLNMIYGGRINTFDPKMYLTNSGITFIRPFALTFESDIAKTCKELNIPIIKSGCPNDGFTKRQEIKELLHSIYHKYPQSKENFLLSLYNDDKVNLYKGIKQKSDD